MTLTPEAQAARRQMVIYLDDYPDLSGTVAGLDLDIFSTPEQMTAWEFAAYDAYGAARCERDGLNTLADLFGPEWVKPWNRRRNLLLAKAELPAVEQEFVAAKELLTRTLAAIASPPDYFPYFQPPKAPDV